MFTMEEDQAVRVLVVPAGEIGERVSASVVIHRAVDAEANLIAGMLIDDELAGNIRVVTMAKDGRPKKVI